MKQRVRVKIEGGILHPVYVPEGVELEVIDFDVEGSDPGALNRYEGSPCRHWVVRPDGSENVCEYDTEQGWRSWSTGQA